MVKPHRRRHDEQAGDNPLLLAYQISTMPQPLQISTTATPATGTLDIYVSEGPATAFCNQIVIAVQVGSDSGCLYAQTPTGAVNSGKWTLSSTEVVDGASIGLADGDWARFIYDLKDNSDDQITYNLVFSLIGQVNNTVATCTVMVQEQSLATNNPPDFQTNQGTFSIALALPQLYLNNFVATKTGSPTVPCTQFGNGEALNFAWESNGTWFELYKKNDTMPIYAGAASSFTLSAGVATDTTFFLIAAMTGDPGQDQPSGGFETIYLYDALTLTIGNPDLTPKSIVVNQDASIGGNLTVTGTAAVSGQSTLGAVAASTLNVAGSTTLAGTTVGGPLSVSGTSTLAAAVINAGLTLQGGATIGGGATINGGLNAWNGSLGLFCGAVAINPGTYTAGTDGFAVGTVGNPPPDTGNLCVCWIAGSNGDGVYVRATGGNHGCFNTDWEKYWTSNGNSFVLPVRRGTTYSLSVQQFAQNQVNAPTWFFWVPLGTAPSGVPFTKTSDAVPDTHRVGGGRRLQTGKEAHVHELINIIGELTDRPIPSATRQRLLTVLTALNGDPYTVETFPQG